MSQLSKDWVFMTLEVLTSVLELMEMNVSVEGGGRGRDERQK